MKRTWSIIEASQYPSVPGVHDLGTPLELAEGSLLFVVLRAAESWIPKPTSIDASLFRRNGTLRVELGEGATDTLDDDKDLLRADSIAALVNVGASLASAIVFVDRRPDSRAEISERSTRWRPTS
jgi:hypothetical protein